MAPRRRQACQRSGWSGGAVLGRGSEEQAKGREEWLSRAFVVLVRATEGVLGLCPGLATAAARWRPAGGSGRRGTAGEAPARSKKRWRGLGAMRGCQREAEVAGWLSTAGGRR